MWCHNGLREGVYVHNSPHFGYVDAYSLENGSRVVGHGLHLLSTSLRGMVVRTREYSFQSFIAVTPESCATPFVSPDVHFYAILLI